MISYFLTKSIYFYQRYISCLKPKCCIYVPTCSQYMLEAIRIHGSFRGTWIGLCRLFRCHPFSKGGWDPVPPPKPNEE